MPIYEYQCTTCSHKFDVFQKFSDKPIKKCEKCGGKVNKLTSLSGFQLKGGGWYSDGYSKKADKASGSDKSESKPESQPEKKADPKPEKKTDGGSKAIKAA